MVIDFAVSKIFKWEISKFVKCLFCGYLSRIELIEQVGAVSQMSMAVTLTSTGTILPLGGQSLSGVTLMLVITGGVVSSTVTSNKH